MKSLCLLAAALVGVLVLLCVVLHFKRRRWRRRVERLDCLHLRGEQSRIDCSGKASKSGRCIAVLARGDPTGRYALLRRRQAALDELPWTAAWDNVIFHEGDIDPQRCGVKAIYVDVSETFKKVKPPHLLPRTHLCKETPLSEFSLGYRAMCLFWFDDFLEYLDGYREVLRVDDDCFLDPGQDAPSFVDGAVFATSYVQGCDEARVVDGMASLFRSLDPGKDFDECAHPYTNVMWVSLDWARATRRRKAPILTSRCIDINRWGDLPLWGFYLKLLDLPISPLKLSYVHGSHGDFRVTPNV